jgi:hypothetical protein
MLIYIFIAQRRIAVRKQVVVLRWEAPLPEFAHGSVGLSDLKEKGRMQLR